MTRRFALLMALPVFACADDASVVVPDDTEASGSSASSESGSGQTESSSETSAGGSSEDTQTETESGLEETGEPEPDPAPIYSGDGCSIEMLWSWAPEPSTVGDRFERLAVAESGRFFLGGFTQVLEGPLLGQSLPLVVAIDDGQTVWRETVGVPYGQSGAGFGVAPAVAGIHPQDDGTVAVVGGGTGGRQWLLDTQGEVLWQSQQSLSRWVASRAEGERLTLLGWREDPFIDVLAQTQLAYLDLGLFSWNSLAAVTPELDDFPEWVRDLHIADQRVWLGGWGPEPSECAWVAEHALDGSPLWSACVYSGLSGSVTRLVSVAGGLAIAGARRGTPNPNNTYTGAFVSFVDRDDGSTLATWMSSNTNRTLDMAPRDDGGVDITLERGADPVIYHIDPAGEFVESCTIRREPNGGSNWGELSQITRGSDGRVHLLLDDRGGDLLRYTIFELTQFDWA